MADENERPRIYVVVKGIVMNGNRTLLVCRNDYLTPEGLDWWEFPGEETGLDVVPGRLLYVWSAQRPKNCQVIIITYLCECEDVSRVQVSDEHAGYMWADVPQMKEKLAKDIIKALDANDAWNAFKSE